MSVGANRVSSFLNIRVADIQRCYEQWSSKGAEFLTPPQQRQTEIRCYIRDPDGHLIEVGQTTSGPGRRRLSPRGEQDMVAGGVRGTNAIVLADRLEARLEQPVLLCR